MSNIRNVQRSGGLIASYTEDEEVFTVTRNGDGKPTFVRSTRGRWVSQEATFTYDGLGKFTGLVGDGFKTSMLPDLLDDANGGATSVSVPVTLSANYTVTADDDGVIFTCTTALTITVPASLSPRPSFIVNPPASGNASIAVSGGANINGATTTLTRSRASNPAGIAVVAYAESDGYGVSGS